MPVFAYRVRTPSGARRAGVLDADSRQAAVVSLRERGLFPTQVEESGTSGGRASDIDRAAILRQLAVLVRGGIPLAEALETSAATAPRRMRSALLRIRSLVREGASLAEACRRDATILQPADCALIEAGEQAGTLPAVLADITDDLERAAEARQAIRSALTYPLITLAVTIVVLGFLIVAVVPEIVLLFSDAGAPLPTATRALMAVAAASRSAGWVVLGAVLATALALRRTASRPRLRRSLDRLVLRLPGLGALVRDATMARVCRSMARSLRAGVPVDRALDLAVASIANRALADDLRRARRALEEGAPLRLALAATGAGSPLLLRLVATGEETGTLATALADVAVLHEQRLQRRTRTALAVAEPAVIVVLGVAVLFIVWAVLVPLLTFDPVRGA